MSHICVLQELAYSFLQEQDIDPEYLIPLTEYITQTQVRVAAAIVCALCIHSLEICCADFAG